MQLVRKWWKLAVSIAALLIAAQIGASFLARARGVHKYLVAHLERAFGRSVEVRHFNILLLPSLVLDAEQISIGEDPAFGNEYFLRAEHLTAGLRWSGLLRGHFEFGTLSLSRPSLILVRNDEGEWNLERWLPPAEFDEIRAEGLTPVERLEQRFRVGSDCRSDGADVSPGVEVAATG